MTDWLLRFLVHPRPALHLAAHGAVLYGATDATIDMLTALGEIASSLGLTRAEMAGKTEPVFTGPVQGSAADPDHLARCCWALALLAEVFRGGPMVAAMGPLARFRGCRVSGDDLLGLAPVAALDQLAQVRHVFETVLIPQLATRGGMWALGPTFTGSELMNADADLIAGGLLLDLKTVKKLSLAGQDLFQLIGYALLDFDDEYNRGRLVQCPVCLPDDLGAWRHAERAGRARGRPRRGPSGLPPAASRCLGSSGRREPRTECGVKAKDLPGSDIDGLGGPP
jgi:hypothetical protein